MHPPWSDMESNLWSTVNSFNKHMKAVSDVSNFVTWCVILLEVAITRLRNALKEWTGWEAAPELC